MATILGSWFGMQAVHESGHIIATRLTGGQIAKVVLHPLTISRTELAANPQPSVVAWSGPIGGVLIPTLLWSLATVLKMPGSFVLRFFVGFCLVANGAYIGVGSFDRVGDAGEMMRHGSRVWHLWLFGVATIPIGFWLWHRQGENFGLGTARGEVRPKVAYGVLLITICLMVFGFYF